MPKNHSIANRPNGIKVAPAMMLWNCLANVRAKREELLKDSWRWDDEGRAYVIQNIDRTQQYLAELKEEILSPGLKRVGWQEAGS